MGALFSKRVFPLAGAYLLDQMALSKRPVSCVAMTATLTMGLRKQFEEMTRMRMDDTIWRSMDRRNITIKVAVGAVTHFHT